MMELNHTKSRIAKLLYSHSLFIFGRMFFEIFMSVYIWKTTQSLCVVSWFNILYLLSHTISFTIFAGIGKKKGIHLLRRGALVGLTILYVFIYLLCERSMEYIFVIGIVSGIFNGMYWIGYKIIRFDLTHIRNRSIYTGLEKAFKITGGILAPVLGGGMIQMNLFGSGYSSIFLFGAALFLGAFIFGHGALPGQPPRAINLKETSIALAKNIDILKSMMGYFFSGISRSGSLIKVIIPLFIFSCLQSEFKLGGILSLFSAVSVLASITLGRALKHDQYKKAVTIGGLAFFIMISTLISFPLFITFVLFGILKENLFILIDIPKKVMSENLIHCMDDHASHRIEYMVIREWLQVGTGRVASYLILLFAGDLTSGHLQYVLIVMAAMVILEVTLLRSIDTGTVFNLKNAGAY